MLNNHLVKCSSDFVKVFSLFFSKRSKKKYYRKGKYLPTASSSKVFKWKNINLQLHILIAIAKVTPFFFFLHLIFPVGFTPILAEWTVCFQVA
jgi:hypothetical protein